VIRIPQQRNDSKSAQALGPAVPSKGISIAPIEPVPEPPIRQGSPFAEGSVFSPAIAVDRLSIAKAGPIEYTAGGALIASAIVAVSTASTLQWFPTGAIVTSALGMLLATLGTLSGRQYVAISLLAIQAILFYLAFSSI
jgi:hypothetical protein